MTARDGGKVGTSVRIESWQQEWLKEHSHLNASEMYRQFLTELADGSTGRPDGVKFRLKMVEEEIEELEDRLEKKREQRDEIRELIEQREQVDDPELMQSLEIVAGRSDPTNPAVKTQAAKHGYTPQEFLEMANKHVGDESEPAVTDGGAPR